MKNKIRYYIKAAVATAILLSFIMPGAAVFSNVNIEMPESLMKTKLGRGDQGWIEQASGFTEPSRGIRYLHAVNESVAWATGYDGSGGNLYKTWFTRTSNGGELWEAGLVITSLNYGLGNIWAIDENTAWAAVFYAGSQNDNCGIYKTIDGGQTWTHQVGPLQGAQSFANNVIFWDENVGMCQGDVRDGYFEVYTTTDGGDNWNRVPQANFSGLPVQTGEMGWTGVIETTGENTAIFGTNKGNVYISNDRGNTWTAYDTPIPAGGLNEGVNDIAFKDELNGLVGHVPSSPNDGFFKLFETSDGGQSWTEIIPDGPAFSNDICYVTGSDNMYVCTGANYQAPGALGVSYSLDGGHNWTVYDGTTGIQFLAQDWVNEGCGWAGGFNQNETTGGMYKYVPPLPTPLNLEGVFNSDTDSVELNWDQPQYSSEEVSYNSGSFHWFMNDGQPYAVKITNPHDSGVLLKSVNFIIGGSEGGPIEGTIDVVVWDDNGGLPGNELYRIEDVSEIPFHAYKQVNVLNSGISIAAQSSVFIGIDSFNFPTTFGILCEDESVPDQGHSFCFAGGFWQLIADAYPDATNLGITATILVEDPEIIPPDSYNIYRSLTSGDFDVPLATGIVTTEYIDGTVDLETTYFYVVTAVYGDDESGYSNEAMVYTGPLTADAGGPYTAIEGEDISFNGTAAGGSPQYNFNWDFGDGNTSDIEDPVHNYSSLGVYTVNLTVTDILGRAVAYDETTATISEDPSTELTINQVSGGMGINASIKNIGDSDAINVSWRIFVTGGFLGLIDVDPNGKEDELKVDEVLTVETGSLGFLHFGKLDITVTAKADNANKVTQDATAFIIGPFVLNVQMEGVY